VHPHLTRSRQGSWAYCPGMARVQPEHTGSLPPRLARALARGKRVLWALTGIILHALLVIMTERSAPYRAGAFRVGLLQPASLSVGLTFH
jgi:hypothetical protein